MSQWVYLSIAIIAEVIATSFLKASAGFSNFWPSVAVVFFYALTFYFLALTLKTLPIGITYAIWAGAGIALITLIGWIIFDQLLDIAAFIGIGLIVSGVIVLKLFSKSITY
jgi:small multidrug resistance pump